MTHTGADLFVEALERYGVTRVFGNPGTTELPVVGALGESDLEYALGLHEDVAVGMAAGYAKTRQYHGAEMPVGVANLHIAPGVAHGLGNLLGSMYAGAPVVVTAGNHGLDHRHEEPILAGDLVAMTDQFTKWSAEVTSVDALGTMLRRAFRVALTPPTGPVFLSIPLDVAMAETDATPERLGAVPSAGAGDPEQIDRAADRLLEAEDVAMVVGDHVARSGRAAVEAAVALAEATGARVHGEILACEVSFPSEHDQWVSFIPPDEGIARTLMSADAVVFAGCSTNTTITRHEARLVPEGTACVHVSPDAWQLGKNQPADAAVLGDPALVLSALADRVADRLPDGEREARLDRVAAAKRMVGAQVSEMADDERPDDPRASKVALVEAMRAVAEDAYVVDEGVTAKYALLPRWPMRPAGWMSNKGGGLGYGLAAAVGAALAERESGDPRDVLGFVGDGSYLYYPHAIHSAVREDLDLTVVVPDNRNYRILKDNAADLLGEGSEEGLPGVEFEPPVDIPAEAAAHGANGHLVESEAGIEGALREALAEPGPSVVDVLVHD